MNRESVVKLGYDQLWLQTASLPCIATSCIDNQYLWALPFPGRVMVLYLGCTWSLKKAMVLAPKVFPNYQENGHCYV